MIPVSNAPAALFSPDEIFTFHLIIQNFYFDECLSECKHVAKSNIPNDVKSHKHLIAYTKTNMRNH